MLASVFNPSPTVKGSTPKYSEWSKHPNYSDKRGYPSYNRDVHDGTDYGTIIFHYHFKEATETSDGYQTKKNFEEQVTQASEDFKDKDFQFVTFNVPEQKKFEGVLEEVGFEKMGESLGGHNTPIYLYVKTKKEAKERKAS